MGQTWSRSIVRAVRRTSRGVKALIAAVTLLTSVITAYQTFYPLAEDVLGIGPPVSCESSIQTFQFAISPEKYQYTVGENVSLYYYVNSDAELEISVGKPDGTEVSAGTFLAATAGTYRIALGHAWFPTGFRRLTAEASSGNNSAHATSFYMVVEKQVSDISPSRAGAKTVKDTFYNSSFQLLALDAEDRVPGEDREVTEFPSQSIGGSISYRLWNTLNMSADQVWQVVLVYSWAQTWPPRSEYQVLYSGAPGRFPVPVRSALFNITAPPLPGSYYVWIIVCPSRTAAEAISNLETPPSLPAHLRIVVKPKLKSVLSLTLPSSELPWGSSVAITGRTEPPVSGAEITLCYSRSQPTDSQLLGHVTADDFGEFSRAWAPPSLGNYILVATWAGSEEIEPVSSMSVPLAVTFPWANVTIIVLLFSIGSLTMFYLIRTGLRERFSRRGRREKIPAKRLGQEKKTHAARKYETTRKAQNNT